MPAFTVHCFNDAYPLYLLMNGMNSFFNSGEWTGYLFMAVSIVTLMGLLAVKQIDPLGYCKAYTLPLFLFFLFFAQTSTIHLQDEWSEEVYSVDNVPIVIALPLHVTSTVEKIFIDLVDEHMTPPTSTSFKEFDFFLEAATLSEVMNGQAFDNFEIQSSIGQYYEDCVLKGVATGFIDDSKFYRSSDLLTALDTSYNIYFTTVYNKDAEPEVMTCSQAYSAIKSAVVNETANVDVSVGSTSNASPLNYINRLFGNRFQSTIEVSSALDNLAETMFPGYQSTSEALFQQAFVMNGLQSNLAQENPQLLAAISQAEVAQTTGIAAASAVYIKKLPRLRAMMKLIIVSLAPIVSACFLAQAGRPALQWAVALLWVSLWLPMMGIIKATYIASAIDELQVMILPTGGLTMPNQIRIMSWLADTSTVAGTLAFMIPALSGIALQMVAPRLAAGIVSSFTAGARISDGFAQRAGMGALGGAERTAKELENDKINQELMEAGDVQSMRLSQMNQLFRNHTGVAVGNFFGSDPTGAGGSHTASMMGMGMSISQSTSKATLDSLSRQQATNEAIATVAASSMAHDAMKSGSTTQMEAASEAVQNTLTEAETLEMGKVHNEILGFVKQATKESGLTHSEQASVATELAVSAAAGFKFFGTGTEVQASGAFKSLESEVGTEAAKAISQSMSNSQEVNNFAEKRSLAVSQARTNMASSGISASDVETKSFGNKTSIADNASSTASFMKSVASSVSATSTAGSNFAFNLGTAAAYLQRDHVEHMASLEGMSSLRSALAENPHADIDSLRRAAYVDLSAMANGALSGNSTSLANFTGALDTMSGFNNYGMQDAAGHASNIMRANALMGDALASAGPVGINEGATGPILDSTREQVGSGYVPPATSGAPIKGGPAGDFDSFRQQGEGVLNDHHNKAVETVEYKGATDRGDVLGTSKPYINHENYAFGNIANSGQEVFDAVKDFASNKK